MAAVSQLSLWLAENPGVESEDNIIPDRAMRGWASSGNPNSSQAAVVRELYKYFMIYFIPFLTHFRSLKF